MSKSNSFLPGTASLVDEIDKKLMIVLRDGRKLIGTMISFDQFANIVLKDTYERIYIEERYGEKKLGIFLIRGENVVLAGEVDEEREAQLPNLLKQVPWDQISNEHKKLQLKSFEEMKKKKKAMVEANLPLDQFLHTMEKDALSFLE